MATKKNPDPGSEQMAIEEQEPWPDKDAVFAPAAKSLAEKHEEALVKQIVKETIVQEKAIVPAPAQTTALTRPLPTVKEAMDLAKFLHDGLMFKKHFPTQAAVVTAIEWGREMGFQPVYSLQNFHVIDGKLGITAQALQALAMIHGIRIHAVEWTDQVVTLRFTRPGFSESIYTYTHNDAHLAGLLHKDNWVKEKKTMLYYRAMSKGLRAFHPDVLSGAYTIDEMQDFGAEAPKITDAQEVNRGPQPAQVEVVESKPLAETPKPEAEQSKPEVKAAPADMQPRAAKELPDPRLLKAAKPTELQISAVFDYLAKLQEFGRDPATLKREIVRRVNKFFKADHKEFDNVTKQQMEWVIDILTKTVKAEEDKAAASNENPL
jgi:hypothetical protein